MLFASKMVWKGRFFISNMGDLRNIKTVGLQVKMRAQRGTFRLASTAKLL